MAGASERLAWREAASHPAGATALSSAFPSPWPSRVSKGAGRRERLGGSPAQCRDSVVWGHTGGPLEAAGMGWGEPSGDVKRGARVGNSHQQGRACVPSPGPPWPGVPRATSCAVPGIQATRPGPQRHDATLAGTPTRIQRRRHRGPRPGHVLPRRPGSPRCLFGIKGPGAGVPCPSRPPEGSRPWGAP